MIDTAPPPPPLTQHQPIKATLPEERVDLDMPEGRLEMDTNMHDNDTHEEPRRAEDKSDDSSEYMLRWSEHNSQLINVFHQLCQDGQFTDVTLATEVEQFQAHKLILSACSPYFRSLFIGNPCKHPIVFLKDVPSGHIRMLLEYMYRGSIAVKQHELPEILRTASSLKIRGLTTAEIPNTDMEDGHKDQDKMDKYNHVETESSHSGVSGRSCSRRSDKEGRKASVPKRIRLSGDSQTSSPRNWPDSIQEPDRPLVISDERSEPDRSPLDNRNHPENRSQLDNSSHLDTLRLVDNSTLLDNRSPLDNIAESDGEEQDIDTDQPVDFSNTSAKIDIAPRFSILGSYLKTGGRTSRTPEEEPRYDDVRRAELAEDLRRAGLTEDLRRAGFGSAGWPDALANLGSLSRGAHRPASRDSRGDSREERDTSAEENNADKELDSNPPLGSLTDSLGIDIAGRLRSHFLANLPSSSYAWLNGVNGLGSQSDTRLPPITETKFDKTIGGAFNRTGEIGANGKPSVACEVCGKKLADPSSLYRHRKIHSGDKPHKCPYCPRRFIQRYNMKQHIKTHRIELLADQKGHDLLPKNHDLGDVLRQHQDIARFKEEQNMSH